MVKGQTFLGASPTLWAGSEESWQRYLLGLETALQNGPTGQLFDASKSEDYSESRLEIVDGIGIIPVTGTLITAHDWWTQGDPDYTSYTEINDMLIQAALDSSVNGIIMTFATPGGASIGIGETSDVINKVSREFKPVASYVGRQALSAGYWLASATDSINAARMGEVGSIGVIAVHKEITKMLNSAGINITVFRDGEYKALGGPYEKLSDTAREILQERLAVLGDEFRSQVAEGRGVTVDYVSQNMGDGKTFFGFQALANRMVDQVIPFEEFFPQFASSLKQGKTPNSNLSKETIMRKNVNAQAAAALAAGIDPKTVLGDPAEGETNTDPNLEGEGQEGAGNPAEGETNGDPKPEGQSTEAAAAPVKNELADFLQTQLAEANNKLAAMTLENQEMKIKLTGLEACQPQMRTIVANSVNGMRIALGGSTMDFNSLPDAALLQMHQTTLSDFQKTFPVGGVSQLPDDGNQQAKASGAGAHKIQAVRIGR